MITGTWRACTVVPSCVRAVRSLAGDLLTLAAVFFSLFVTEDGVYAMGNTKRSRIGRHNGDALTRAERLEGGLVNKGRPFAVTAGDNFSVVLL
jgi:hypothetical protein